MRRNTKTSYCWILSLTCCLFWSVGATNSDEEWRASAVQAILQQLKEVRREMQSLRQDLRKLQQTVNKLSKSGVSSGAVNAPPPAAIDLSDINGSAMGSSHASIAILEFTDYQCPFCKRFHSQAFPQLKETYIKTGKVRYLTKDFPLPLHPHAKGAAVALRCAGNQGGFWQMREEVFSEQDRLGPSLYKELAQKLKLNMPDFETCLKDAEQTEKVNRDLVYGQSIGVRGTPTFLIGKIQDGKIVSPLKLSGAQPFTSFSQAIDPLLK